METRNNVHPKKIEKGVVRMSKGKKQTKKNKKPNIS